MSDKEKLRQWLKDNGINITRFQQRMGYGSYAYAHGLLSGDDPLPDSVLGRLARCLPDALFAIRDELRPCEGDDTTDNIPQDDGGGASNLHEGNGQDDTQ